MGPTSRSRNIITCLDALSPVTHHFRVQCTQSQARVCHILIRNKNRILLSSHPKAPPDFPHVSANHLIAVHVYPPSHLGRSKTCGPHTLAPALPHALIYIYIYTCVNPSSRSSYISFLFASQVSRSIFLSLPAGSFLSPFGSCFLGFGCDLWWFMLLFCVKRWSCVLSSLKHV